MSETATHGTVRDVPVADIRPGMRIEKDVMGRGGKVLAHAGEVVSQKHVKKFNEWEAREKPEGPVLAKKNRKDRRERVQRGEWQGGYKLSHFNPRGIRVSTTIASGDESPAVDSDPTRSRLFQDAPRKSHSVPIDVESPLIRIMEMKAEVRVLEATNKKLEGTLHDKGGKEITESDWTSRRDALNAENDRLLSESLDARTAPPAGRKK